MITLSNEQMSWEDSHKKIPTIDILDPLTVTNYGKLRRIMLDYGQQYIYRQQIVYSNILILSFA